MSGGCSEGSAPASPPSAATLAECIAAVAERQDRAAFDVLFVHFSGRLKTYLSRYAGMEAGEAEETIQEVMLIVWRKAAQFDLARASPSTWIYTIARNACLDRLRGDRKRVAHSVPMTEEVLNCVASDTAQDAEQLLATASRDAHLREALLSLPTDQMEVLKLAYFGGSTHEEIARRTGLPLGTVKGRIRSAMTRLRTRLREVDLT